MIKYFYKEGQTPLDDLEKKDLLLSIIDHKELDIFEQENILEAHDWIMKNSVLSKQDIFTEEFLLKLHKKMYRHVWKWAGKYRKTNKNIGVEYFEIPIELHKLLEDTKYWLKNKTYTINELAVIFHHRLVKIHLFSNGNGRHARLCADVIIAKCNGDKLTWSSNNIDLNKVSDLRKAYISALKEADQGNYNPLFKFCF